MALANPPTWPDVSHNIHSARHFSWTAGFPYPSRLDAHAGPPSLYDIKSSPSLEYSPLGDINALTTFDRAGTEFTAPRRATNPEVASSGSQTHADLSKDLSYKTPCSGNKHPRRPFHKWMRSLHRRVSHRDHEGAIWPADAGWQYLESNQSYQQSLSNKLSRRLSSSGSSLGLIAAVQSASISLASGSAVSRSRRHHGRSRCRSRAEQSSRASLSAPRFSEDSIPLEKGNVDVAEMHRSIRRRQILEELISTEEGYIGDVRFLIHTYINMLAALPTLPERLRSSINHNLDRILQLHEEILGELHRVVPDSEYSQADHLTASFKVTSPKTGHRWWGSLDVLPEDQVSLQRLEREPGIFPEPQIAAEVAKVFSKRMHQFFVYREYGAKYETMIKDVTSALESLPEWEAHQKGLEAFAFTIGAAPSSNDRKSLTIGDLLVKPIQRVCRYPLLFAELLKCTPVIDCPNSHMEVETALMRLREATSAINRSTEDNLMKETLEKTWLLQDRIVFPNRRLDANSKNQVRSFGHIQLCGVLHVCWQTSTGVDGQYMICLLYKDVLCLACGGRYDPIYTVVACIDIHSTTIEDVDNGRGLQCHLAPFSWKLVFKIDHQLYEVVMTACTSKEESEWRSRLSQPTSSDTSTRAPGLNLFLSIDIRSLGAVFGRPGTIARSLSTHRTSAREFESSALHFILKNTCAARSSNPACAGTGLNRSQSLLTTKKARTPVLVPSRSERARLEILVADVWSHGVLPLPSMTNVARNEQAIRRSASTVMRKLSVSSMARRSGSVKRKIAEDLSSEEQAHHNSISSDSGVDVFDKNFREGSSHSYTTRSSLSPETQELGEECQIPDTQSPRLELTQISELEPLDLIGIISKKQLQSGSGGATARGDHMVNKLATKSSRTQAKENSPLRKDNSTFWVNRGVQIKDTSWMETQSPDSGKKHTGIRRFFH
ncbi:hypothetical protein HYE68_006517 [Fusarium pseudograminearum]|nr:hypothetical protein HYE68_006517 [Fusarium pseudograminearum]